LSRHLLVRPDVSQKNLPLPVFKVEGASFFETHPAELKGAGTNKIWISGI